MGLLKFFDRFPHKTQTGGGIIVNFVIDEVVIYVEDEDEVIVYVEGE